MVGTKPAGFNNFFTARRSAGAVFAVVLSLSVCPSHAGIAPKRLKKIELVFSMEVFFCTCSTLCCKEIQVSPK